MRRMEVLVGNENNLLMDEERLILKSKLLLSNEKLDYVYSES